MKKYKRCALRLLPLLPLFLWLFLEFSSRSAAFLFNLAMEEQDMLRGKLTVESISADIMGNVEFENLLWTDPGGTPILRIPSGAFQVSLWDVVTRQFRSATLQSLTLRDASISLYLDENMNPDIVRGSEELRRMEEISKKRKENRPPPPKLSAEERKQRGELARETFQRQVSSQLRNFHHEGKDLRLDLALERCRIEVLYGNRHYLIGGVNIKAHIDTRKEISFRSWTSFFGGTMVGRGIFLQGAIDMTADPVPTCNLAILLEDVDPSSLGLGSDVHDRMTLSTYFSGPVTAPIGIGTVRMEELHIPGLDFFHVEGDVRYENAKLEFQDVTADVYGGKLSAKGVYDFDTRHYRLECVGEDLKTGKALPGSGLSCSVLLHLTLESKGSAKETYASGTLASGPGTYQTWIPFDRISGQFSNAYHDLRFYDVNIEVAGYRLSTDAFSIIDKKLTLNPIRLTNEEGRLLLTYDPALKDTVSPE